MRFHLIELLDILLHLNWNPLFLSVFECEWKQIKNPYQFYAIAMISFKQWNKEPNT